MVDNNPSFYKRKEKRGRITMKKIVNLKDKTVNIKVDEDMYQDILRLVEIHNKKSIAKLLRGYIEQDIINNRERMVADYE